MTFFLKEVYDYSSAKHDGIQLNNLRRAKLDLNNLKIASEKYSKVIN
jgi:hypothetical protein